MAEEKKGGLKSNTEVAGTLLGIIFVLVIVSALVGSIQNRLAGGGKIDAADIARSGLFYFSSRVNEYTPIGTEVVARKTLDVWASALRDRILGTQPKGAFGRLVSGPEILGSSVWWNVDFENDPDGWVDADDLRKRFTGTVASIRFWFLLISSVLTIVGIFVALYSHKKWSVITAEHRKQMKQLEKKLVEKDIASKNERWDRVEQLIASENPGDWRIAILEADVMLDELVTSMGYPGETLGDKMKGVEKSDFTTIEAAWEAHKVRNRIAHHGSDFILTHREAKRIIALFEEVFKEFDVV